MSDQDNNVSLPANKMPALRVIPMPKDANPNGDVFGGWIMSQVDLAGSVAASYAIAGRFATVAVHSFVFKQPVFVGDLLTLYANVEKIGNTSITIKVEVYAQRWHNKDEVFKVTEATLVYVALDEARKPRQITNK